MESAGADVIIERLRRARQQNPKSLHDREAAQLAALCLRLPESKLDDEQPAGRLVEARQIRKFNPQLLLGRCRPSALVKLSLSKLSSPEEAAQGESFHFIS